MANHKGRLTYLDGQGQDVLSMKDSKYDYTFADPSDYRASEIRVLHDVDRIEDEVPAERPDDRPAASYGGTADDHEHDRAAS